MPWVRFDDMMPDHPKIAALSDAAFRAHVTAICYSARNLTDGFIPAKKGKEFAGRPRAIQELVPALWVAVEGGYMVHDYLKYQPTREQVLSERDAAKTRMQVARSGGVRANKYRTNGRTSLAPVPVPVPTPVPVPKEFDEVGEVAGAFAKFGSVTSGTVQAVEYAITDFGIDWVRRAVHKAAGSKFEGQPPWSYVESMLERWKKQGAPDDEQPRAGKLQTAGRHTLNGHSGGSDADLIAAVQANTQSALQLHRSIRSMITNNRGTRGTVSA